MAANVLASSPAIEMSVQLVRIFVHRREILAANKSKL